MNLISTHIVRKSDIGIHDNLFGGELMSWIDLAGAAYATEICGTEKMVTKKVSELVFYSPVKVNSLVKIYGSVVKIGKTSATFNITVQRFDVITKNTVHVCNAEIVFVRIDEYGQARDIDEKVREIYTPKPKERKPILTIDDVQDCLIPDGPEKSNVPDEDLQPIVLE